MYMCPCTCSYVCTNVWKCVYTCINVNMSLESMNNFGNCTSGAICLVFWSRVAIGLWVTTLAGLVGQGVLGSAYLCLPKPEIASVHHQDWLSPAWVLGIQLRSLHLRGKPFADLFLFCSVFCLAFVFCLFGWFCCHGLFVRFWDDRCAPPHQASAVEIMPHWCLQDRGWSGWGDRCHLLLCI